MRGTTNYLVECPFFISCGAESIICEGLIKGTNDKHVFNNERERRGYEKMVCSKNCGRTCLHYKRVNELYEKVQKGLLKNPISMKSILQKELQFTANASSTIPKRAPIS